MTTYWLEGIKKERISSGLSSSKLQYYSHLKYDPDQEIEDKETSDEESAQDLSKKLKQGDAFNCGQNRLPSADLIQLSIQTPSLQLFDSETEELS